MFDFARRWVRRSPAPGPEPELEPFERDMLRQCQPFTMTGPERLLAVSDAVAYACARGVPGALVECGVWQGGSVMAMLLALLRAGERDRDVWLYDTFEGMTAPGAHDTSAYEAPALRTWAEATSAGKRPWDGFFDARTFNEERVRATLERTGYPPGRLHFVKGKVEETIPAAAPAQVALLRLDTDWYESTRHELQHLYPRLSPGGVLIVDDYGHWRGCRRAVDEYFASGAAPPVLLSRIDYTGRMAIKH